MKKMLAAAGASVCVLGIGLLLPGLASAQDTLSYQATLNPITANKVSGNGASWISVTGTRAEVKIQVNGLLDGAPHAQHIHDAQGKCPTKPAQHNGLPSINVADGAPLYGGIGTSLTNAGDTSPAAALAVERFPSTGSYTYSRTIELDPNVVANLKKGTAVLVVHGIDYNNNGKYDGVLGTSELDTSLPAEATDPALCGAFAPMQMAGVPAGAANTGGGSSANQGHTTEIAVGAAALLAAGGAALVALRRRPTTQD